MTIEKGKDWGSRGLVAEDVPIVASDRELAALFSVSEGDDSRVTISGPELVGLVPGGDTTTPPRESSNGLAKTLGARGTIEALRSSERTIVPIDLGIVTLAAPGPEISRFVMASSLVISSRFWAGVTEGAMNAAFLGEWNVTPTGHPNDGRFDVVRVEMSMSDRLKARKRLPSGTHLPHPDISIRRLKNATFSPAPSARVWVDGQPHRACVEVALTVIPDAVLVAI